MNFKKETLKLIKKLGKTEGDISFIAFRENDSKSKKFKVYTKAIDWEALDFNYVASFMEDLGFKSDSSTRFSKGGVDMGSVVVFRDATWLSRNDLDGDTYWEYKKTPVEDKFY